MSASTRNVDGRRPLDGLWSLFLIPLPVLSPQLITTFVDWDTARRVNHPDHRHGRLNRARRDLAALQEALARVLAEQEPQRIFRVSLRIYHGWYAGTTPTKDHRELRECGQESNRIGRVSFAPITLGTHLLCSGPRSALYDTFRTRPAPGQKMVDTALVSDLLHFARTAGHRGEQRALVVGDDDDLLPGVFTALQWGAHVRIARLREDDNAHLNTHNLIYRIQL